MADEEQYEAPEESSMRDDMLDAIEDVSDSTDETDDLREDDNDSEAVEQTETGEAQEETQEEVSGQEEQQQTTVKANAPIGWSPTNKEKWAELPPEIQEAVHNRELEVNQMFQETAEDRRTAGNFNQLCSSYAPVFAGEGITNYMEGVQGLMNITAELQQGGPVQKAQRIAGLIGHYGVDIEALDNILSGQQPTQEQQGQDQIQQYIQQQMAPVNQLMSQINDNRQYQQDQVEQEAYDSITDFGQDQNNNHFESVRFAMADFLDMAAQNGQQMTLPEAYDRACAMNPEIAGIVAQQRASQQQQSGAGASQRRQNAASSISGRRQGNDSMTGGGNMRDVMETAWDEANSG